MIHFPHYLNSILILQSLVAQCVHFNEWFTEFYLNCIVSLLVLIVVISPALSSIRQNISKAYPKNTNHKPHLNH